MDILGLLSPAGFEEEISHQKISNWLLMSELVQRGSRGSSALMGASEGGHPTHLGPRLGLP